MDLEFCIVYFRLSPFFARRAKSLSIRIQDNYADRRWIENDCEFYKHLEGFIIYFDKTYGC